MSAEPAIPYTVVPDGSRLAVRLTPRVGCDALAGVSLSVDGREVLGVRVAAPPLEGKANAALVAFLARSLKLRRSDITLVSGETARLMLVHLAGEGPALVAKTEPWFSVVRSETRPR